MIWKQAVISVVRGLAVVDSARAYLPPSSAHPHSRQAHTRQRTVIHSAVLRHLVENEPLQSQNGGGPARSSAILEAFRNLDL